jgi:hypothetical protein
MNAFSPPLSAGVTPSIPQEGRQRPRRPSFLEKPAFTPPSDPLYPLHASRSSAHYSAMAVAVPCFIPWRAHPDVALLVSSQDHRHRLPMDRLHHGVRRGRQEAVNMVRPRHRLALGAAITVEGRPDCRRSRSTVGRRRARTRPRSFFLVSGFGSGAYSANELNGTRQRFSGFSQLRQCGEEVLRMLVTGGPPVRGGGGMPSASWPARCRCQCCGSPEPDNPETRPASARDCRRNG